jgi:hypothetical protein
MVKSTHGWVLALIAALVGVGCGAADDAAEPVEAVDDTTAPLSAEPGKCFHGMTTALQKMRPPSDFATGAIPNYSTCTLAEVPEMVNWVCATEPEVCAFLQSTLSGHARIQCQKYIEGGVKKTCVDVVERYPDGSPIEGKPFFSILNFFVAYAIDDHFPLSPEVAYWNGKLIGPDKAAPVLLSTVGYYHVSSIVGGTFFSTSKPAAVNRLVRALMFDPRDCGDCGIYDGPSIDEVANITDLVSWFPSFTSTSCRFQPDPDLAAQSDWVLLPQPDCNAEAAYRLNGR